ncbi:hypothetical protein [Paenibacillus periandrae]|uniref:hypothetical protein n=1 Tax=Paenibacillus periandrae TaxID=1761741 RepID=UPI001F08AD3E|nr:hypothetical protein [Paenibacillus periandrae]
MSFEDILNTVNWSENINVQFILAENGRTLQQLKSDVLKTCYEALRQWNIAVPKPRDQNEHFIKSFVRMTA